jgi:hypothetical protein
MAKDSLIQDRQLEVLEVCIPLFITGNATPASKTLANDEPARLFLNAQGISQITLANGAVDSSAELSAITFQSLASGDASGKFSGLLRINEPIVKVLSLELIQRTGGNSVVSCDLTSAPSSGITSGGDKVVFDATVSSVNFSSANLDACLVARVQVRSN